MSTKRKRFKTCANWYKSTIVFRILALRRFIFTGSGAENLLVILGNIPSENYLCENWETNLLIEIDDFLNKNSLIQIYHVILANYVR